MNRAHGYQGSYLVGFIIIAVVVLRAILALDAIVVDTPPCLVVSDSTILSATTEMRVVLLLEAGRTKRVAATKSKLLFTQLGGTIAGVVLNKANPRDEDYYGYGYYTYYRQSPGETDDQNSA